MVSIPPRRTWRHAITPKWRQEEGRGQEVSTLDICASGPWKIGERRCLLRRAWKVCLCHDVCAYFRRSCCVPRNLDAFISCGDTRIEPRTGHHDCCIHGLRLPSCSRGPSLRIVAKLNLGVPDPRELTTNHTLNNTLSFIVAPVRGQGKRETRCDPQLLSIQ